MKNGKNYAVRAALTAAALVLIVLAQVMICLPAEAASPKLNKKKVTLYVEQTVRLKVNNTKAKVTWSSNKKAVASVSKKGVVTAKKAGKAKITAKVSGRKYTCAVTVRKPKLNISKATVYVGKTRTLKVIKTSKKITWSSSDRQVAVVSRKGVVTGKWSGTAVITAKFGKQKRTCRVTVKRDPNARVPGADLSDQVAPLPTDQIRDFTSHVKDVSTGTSSDEYGQYYHYTVSMDPEAQIVKDLEAGVRKTGEVIMIPCCDQFPAGFYFTLTSYSMEGDTCILKGRQPELDEMFKGDGKIDFSRGIDPDDPLAFVLGADGTLTGPGGKVLAGSVQLSDASTAYTRSVFPEGLKLKPTATVAPDNSVSVQVSLDDTVLYDKDKDKETSSDQVILDGSVGLLNIQTNGGITFGDGLAGIVPEQIAMGFSYDINSELRVKTKSELTFDDIVKSMKKDKISKDYQKCLPGKDLGPFSASIEGIDLSQRLYLFTIGLKSDGLMACPGIDKAVQYRPVVFITFYVDLDGKISCEASFGARYESHVERGFDLYDSKGAHVTHDHAFDQNKTIAGNYMLGSYEQETASRTDKSAPRAKIGFNMKGQIQSSCAFGAMGGISAFNVVPGGIYGELSSGLNGSIEGSFEGMTEATSILDFFNSEAKLLLEHYKKATAGIDLDFALRVGTKYMNLVNLKAEASVVLREKEFYRKDLEYPAATVSGVVRDSEINQDLGHDPVGGATVDIYRKARLTGEDNTNMKAADIPEETFDQTEPDFTAVTEEDGTYQAEHLEKDLYVMKVRRDGWHSRVSEFKVVADKDGYAKDLSQDSYIHEYNWLDECAPVEFVENGTAALYDGGNKDKYFTVSGVPYGTGITLDNGNQGTGGSCDAIFELNGKYDALDVRIGHVDSTSLLHGILRVYLADTREEVMDTSDDHLFQTVQLTSWDASKRVTLDLKGARYCRLSLIKTQWDNWMHSAWGLVEGVWTPAAGAEPPAYNTTKFRDPYANKNMEDTRFNYIVPLFRGVGCTNYDGGTQSFTFAGSSDQQFVGFVLTSHSVGDAEGNPKACFFPNGRYQRLELDVGFVSKIRNSEFYVYLDGDTENALTYSLTDGVQHIGIPLSGARSVCISTKNQNDGWSTDKVGFANGIWY